MADYVQNQRPGTGFTNLQSILGANNPNQLTSNIAGNLQNTANQAVSNLSNAQNNFEQAANQGNLANAQNQTEVTNTLNNVTNPSNSNFNYGQFNLSSNNPFYTSQTGSDFGKFLGGQYSGPSDINNISQIQGQLNNAQQLGQDVNTQAGKVGLLQNYIGSANPQYNFGEQNLDAALLGGPQLNQAAQGTYGLGGLGAQAQQAALNTAAQDTAASQAFGQNTQQQLANATAGVNQNVQNTVNQDLTNYNNALSGIQALNPATNPGTTQMSAQTAALTGIAPNTQTFNINPYNYATPEQAPNAQNAATSQEVAQLQALNQLSGGAGGNAPQLSNLTYNPAVPYTFNLTGPTGYQAAVNTANQNLQNALATAPDPYATGQLSTTMPNTNGTFSIYNPASTTQAQYQNVNSLLNNYLTGTGQFAGQGQGSESSNYYQGLSQEQQALQNALNTISQNAGAGNVIA
jgi:hypothetical protein